MGYIFSKGEGKPMADFEKILSEKWFGDWAHQEAFELSKLKGDASYRSYFRVKHVEGTSILMQWDPALTARAEEAGKGTAIDELPFLNVQRYLHAGGIRVPSVQHASVDVGLILLQDLGDATMEREFTGQSLAHRHRLYRHAIENLVAMQALGEKSRDDRCVAFHRAFDRDLYLWEFNHYVEYGIEARQGLKVPADDRDAMAHWFGRIAGELDGIPKGFTHRDYQSRNLMFNGGDLFVIDFQDALLGPPQYDVVALLRDSYVSIEEDEAGALVDHYLRERKRAGIPLEAEAFWRGFKLQTIQRKLKDGARFVFIDKVKNNPSFLPHVPQSFEYVRRYLSTMPELKELHELLARYTPELR